MRLVGGHLHPDSDDIDLTHPVQPTLRVGQPKRGRARAAVSASAQADLDQGGVQADGQRRRARPPCRLRGRPLVVLRCATCGLTICSISPTSRSAADLNARMWRGSSPNAASLAIVSRRRARRRRSSAVPGRGFSMPKSISSVELLVGQPGVRQQLGARHPHVARRSRPEVRGVLVRAGHAHRGRGRLAGLACRVGRRLESALHRVELLLDDLQRVVVVALLGEDVAQPLQVGPGELPVARRRALGLDQPLGLEEADLGDADLGEVRAQLVEDLADAHPAAGRRWRWPRTSDRGAHAVTVLRAVEVDEPVLADLDLVATGQQHLVDPVAVDVGAVEAADVGDQVAVATYDGTRRGGGSPSRRRGRSRCRDDGPADTSSVSSRNRLPALGPRWTTSSALPSGSASTAASSASDRLADCRLAPVGTAEVQRGGGLGRRLARRPAVAALSTEPGAVRVLVSALRAERHVCLLVRRDAGWSVDRSLGPKAQPQLAG